MNSLIWLILDSCRHDSFVRARTPHFDRFLAANDATVECRWSYASFTAPAHYAFLMGLTPHACPPGTLAAEVYQRDYAAWGPRLGLADLDFARFLPRLSLPHVLRELGYRTTARVSLPVLNEATLLATDFDSYRLMDSPNQFALMIDELSFPSGQPQFYFLNLGETHYPYLLDGDVDGIPLPRLSGVHGAVRSLAAGAEAADVKFTPELLRKLHDQQVRCVEHVDQLFGRLVERIPPGTHIIVTADHGEVFGEDGYFGHGPVRHEKVFEVPFFEGRVGGAAHDSLRERVLNQMKSLGYV